MSNPTEGEPVCDCEACTQAGAVEGEGECDVCGDAPVALRDFGGNLACAACIHADTEPLYPEPELEPIRDEDGRIVDCTECADLGWILMDGRGPGIERCDSCSALDSDDAAQVAWIVHRLREAGFQVTPMALGDKLEVLGRGGDPPEATADAVDRALRGAPLAGIKYDLVLEHARSLDRGPRVYVNIAGPDERTGLFHGWVR
ncbi:MAG: hypothetical protein ACOCUS_02520 [Polyangiales bacterium]